MASAAPVDAGGRTFLGQPRGLSTLFFTEMWERFSYYRMRAILVLYLTAPLTGDNPGLDIDSGTAMAIYGSHVGLVHLTPIAGAWIADRILGGRRTVLTADDPNLAFAVCGGLAIGFGALMLVMARRISALMGHVHWAGMRQRELTGRRRCGPPRMVRATRSPAWCGGAQRPK